jgi:hypothetical protein
MSRLYFTDSHGEAELKGSEKAHMRGLAFDLGWGMMAPHYVTEIERLGELIKPGHYLANHSPERGYVGWAEGLRISMSLDNGDFLSFRGHPINGHNTIMNTAAKVGNDVIKLAVRLHCQAELNCWVDGPNREWMADIMQRGLDLGIFRTGLWNSGRGGTPYWSDQGWGEVIPFLRERDDDPVVVSYSVTGESLGELARGDMPFEEWDALGQEERWALSLKAVRESDDNLEMSPADWPHFYFDHGITALDLVSSDRDRILARKLGLED